MRKMERLDDRLFRELSPEEATTATAGQLVINNTLFVSWRGTNDPNIGPDQGLDYF